MSLFYLRAYARKNYATVEIHLKAVRGNPTAHDIPRLTNSYKYLRQTFIYSHRRIKSLGELDYQLAYHLHGSPHQ